MTEQQEQSLVNKLNMPSNIYFNKQLGKWHARKYKYNRNNHIGYFDTYEEAVQAQKEFMNKSPQAVFEAISRKQVSELTMKYGPKQ